MENETVEEDIPKESDSGGEGFAPDQTGSTDPEIVIPVEIREYTPFVTESGTINVIHEITLGELLISTLILALIAFTVISRLIRR